MNSIVFTACTSFIAVEMISFLSGSEKTVKAVCSLAVTLIMFTAIVNAVNEFDINFDIVPKEADIEPLYLSEAQEILKKQITDTLGAAGVYDIKPEIILTMDEDYEVLIDTVKVGVKHPSDMERTRIILREMFSDSLEGEVYLID